MQCGIRAQKQGPFTITSFFHERCGRYVHSMTSLRRAPLSAECEVWAIWLTHRRSDGCLVEIAVPLWGERRGEGNRGEETRSIEWNHDIAARTMT